ncbi:hypothetical protein H0G86_010953 [Trichoderma simmonsii]|uniref:Uncharacterized protein n=1 Tax=Trichoderma simmonsii TaxID=1491479 RepID=A0A8G0PPH0_9HYPO|nr:hypothetical protein H0G86_010953 [Trichoderma simmonsii]
MQLVSVSLPDLSLISNEQQLDFSLGGTLQLRFPDGVDVPRTSSDLLKLVTEKHLWIARTGSCYFRLDVSVQGEPVLERNHIAKLVEWVWSRAGICLHVQDKDSIESSGTISFSIQHPDLSSTLITQRDAFTAEFESVNCRIDLSPNKDERSLGKRSLKRKRAKQANECVETRRSDDVFADDEYLVDLTPDDQKAIDAFIQSLNMIPTQQGRSESTPRSGPSCLTSGKLEFSESFKQLFEVALEILVLGSRKQYRGITTVNRTHAECLIRLAPAVFNRPYLKTICDRASLLPIIATSLARMKNAESPSLRQKAASFAAQVADVGCDYNDRVIRGIEKSTWDVLLSTTKIPKLPGKGGHDVQTLASNVESKSETGFCEHTVVEKEEKEDTGLITPSSTTLGENHEEKQSILSKRNPIFFESQQVSLPEVQASSDSLLASTPICYTQAESSYTFNSSGMDNKALMGGGKYEHPFTADTVVWNHDPWPMDVGSLTFDEWLCPSESTAECWGI